MKQFVFPRVKHTYMTLFYLLKKHVGRMFYLSVEIGLSFEIGISNDKFFTGKTLNWNVYISPTESICQTCSTNEIVSFKPLNSIIHLCLDF